jgi:ABC-type spermidine/putrescine transport system permease subunit II
MTSLARPLRGLLAGLVLGLLAFVILGPLVNLALWAVAERWYFPNRLPSQYGFAFWARVFSPRGGAWNALGTSVLIALATVLLSLAVALPAGWALARLRMPGRALVLLIFLLPQAFPNLPVYINIARIFYWWGLNGTIVGVVLVHTLHGLVFAVWITTAAFAAVDRDLEEAARNMGAGPLRTFFTVTLPLAGPGILAASIFVFLESLDEFTGTYFVGVPDVTTLPLLMFNAAMGGNYQIAAITASILLVPSLLFMAVIERFLKAEVLAKVGT